MTDEERKEKAPKRRSRTSRLPRPRRRMLREAAWRATRPRRCGRPSAVCDAGTPMSCEITQAFCQLKSRKIVVMAQ